MRVWHPRAVCTVYAVLQVHRLYAVLCAPPGLSRSSRCTARVLKVPRDLWRVRYIRVEDGEGEAICETSEYTPRLLTRDEVRTRGRGHMKGCAVGCTDRVRARQMNIQNGWNSAAAAHTRAGKHSVSRRRACRRLCGTWESRCRLFQLGRLSGGGGFPESHSTTSPRREARLA